MPNDIFIAQTENLREATAAFLAAAGVNHGMAPACAVALLPERNCATWAQLISLVEEADLSAFHSWREADLSSHAGSPPPSRFLVEEAEVIYGSGRTFASITRITSEFAAGTFMVTAGVYPGSENEPGPHDLIGAVEHRAAAGRAASPL